MTEPAPPRPRNRAETENRILDAARRLIARDGFGGLGVNALAAEAECDKKLITRYFGGLEGVVEALGGALGFWTGAPSPPSLDGSDLASYPDRMAALLALYRESLEANALLQSVLAAELSSPSKLLSKLEVARDAAMGAWMASARGDARPDDGVDAPAVNAVILAALHYLTLRTRTVGGFAGVDLSGEEGRARIRRAMEKMLRCGLRA